MLVVEIVVPLYRFRHCEAVRSTQVTTEQEQLPRAGRCASRSAVDISVNYGDSKNHRFTVDVL